MKTESNSTHIRRAVAKLASAFTKRITFAILALLTVAWIFLTKQLDVVLPKRLVIGGSASIYIISATHDPSFPNTVQIVGLNPRNWTDEMFCHFFFDNKTVTTKVDMKSLLQKSGTNFHIQCPMPKNSLKVKWYMDISLTQSELNPGNKFYTMMWNTVIKNIHVPIFDDVPELLIAEAYHDLRFPRQVFIIGLGRCVRKEKMYCHFHLGGRNRMSIIAKSAPVYSYGNQYDGCFITCPIPDTVKIFFPSWRISLSLKEKFPGRKLFSLIRIPKDPPKAPTIAICINPIHFNISLVRMMGWIEMNRMVGVNHFAIYDYEMSAEFVQLMHFYQSKGIVSILKWNTESIPVSTVAMWPPHPAKLYYFGQFAAYNDCLYRFGNRFRYLMFTDIDEVITPLINNITINDYIKGLDHDNIAEFKFRNSYVRLDYPKDPLARKIDPVIASENVPFIDFTRREKRILENIANKVIVKFNYALKMGVHKLLSKSKGGTHHVPVQHAIIFHYRTPPPPVRIPDAGEQSPRLMQIVPELIRAVQKIKKEFKAYSVEKSKTN